VQLTKRSSYGLIATLELAGAEGGGPVSAAEIAKRYSLSRSFVEKILHQLRCGGLVRSTQGRKGGYRLARPPEDIAVREVLEALGETLHLVGCLGPGRTCELTRICPTRRAWGRIDRRILQMLDSLTLGDLIEQSEAD